MVYIDLNILCPSILHTYLIMSPLWSGVNGVSNGKNGSVDDADRGNLMI